jgi:hypothetical protein
MFLPISIRNFKVRYNWQEPILTKGILILSLLCIFYDMLDEMCDMMQYTGRHNWALSIMQTRDREKDKKYHYDECT